MERIALDLRNYDSLEKLGNLITDTASLAIEASNNPDIPRVNLHHYIKKGEDCVISPGKDKRDVLEKFTSETDLDKKATIAGQEIRRILLEEKVGTVFVWISPKDPYPETRVVVGVKKETKSGRYSYLECYGISTELSRDDSLLLMQFMVSVSKKEYQYPIDPEDLRSFVITLDTPDNKEPFKYLSEIVNLPEKNRFESILDGSAKKLKADATRSAVIATKPIINNHQLIYTNPIGYGGYIETQMKYLGYGMNPKKFGCGISNNEAMNGYYSNTTASYAYSYQNETTSWEYHIGDCVNPGCERKQVDVGPCNICKICEKKL